jgi:hypothetical protein
MDDGSSRPVGRAVKPLTGILTAIPAIPGERAQAE